MSDSHNDTAEADSAANTVKTAIIVFVGAILMVIGIGMLAHFAIGTRPIGAGNENANTPEAVAGRIAHPVSLAVDPTKGPVPGAAAAPAPAAVKAGAPATAIVAAVAIPVAAVAGAAKAGGGEGIYKTACAACHSAGIAGAPKSGDKAAWAPRIAQGKDTLYKHAIGGYQGKNGVMPAKGGNTSLADADVKSAVDYMVALNK